MKKTPAPDVKLTRILGLWDGKSISVDPDQSDVNIFSTIIHELLHCIFDKVASDTKLDDFDHQETVTAECERLLADTLCKHFHIKCKPAFKKRIRREIKDIRPYRVAKTPTRGRHGK